MTSTQHSEVFGSPGFMKGINTSLYKTADGEILNKDDKVFSFNIEDTGNMYLAESVVVDLLDNSLVEIKETWYEDKWKRERSRKLHSGYLFKSAKELIWKVFLKHKYHYDSYLPNLFSSLEKYNAKFECGLDLSTVKVGISDKSNVEI